MNEDMSQTVKANYREKHFSSIMISPIVMKQFREMKQKVKSNDNHWMKKENIRCSEARNQHSTKLQRAYPRENNLHLNISTQGY